MSNEDVQVMFQKKKKKFISLRLLRKYDFFNENMKIPFIKISFFRLQTKRYVKGCVGFIFLFLKCLHCSFKLAEKRDVFRCFVEFVYIYREVFVIFNICYLIKRDICICLHLKRDILFKDNFRL